tara:strand:+ start:202 stop:645 length:444 start_codon:yes stop_codon:yes gene_type:complete
MSKEAYHCALRLLTRREHGEQELMNKLMQKGFSETNSCDAVRQCQSQGYQNDARYAENIFRSRASQGYGPLRIEMQLKQAGVCSDIIEQARDALDMDWVAIAHKVYHKKYRSDVEITFKVIQKQKQFLMYRGFSSSVINQLFELLEV